MAVMRNSIIFGGVDSADYGIYIGGEGTFNAPKRDVEMISIPGRNGAFALDKGRFENIEVTYSAFNYETDLATFAQNLSDFRNAICSQKGYQRLTDTFHPDEYRMAAYIDGLEIKPIDYNTASTFDIVFDCKPQRFLTSGEDPITIGEWNDTETASGTIASFEAVEGDGVKSLVVDIEPYQSGSGTPSPDNVRPISGYDSVVTSVTGFNMLDAETGVASGTATYAGGVITNTIADTATSFNPTIQFLKNNTPVYRPDYIVNTTIGPRRVLTFPSGDYDADCLRLKHNGTSRDIPLVFAYNVLKNVIYCISYEQLSGQPNVAGGIRLKDICLSFNGSRNGAYEPYQGTTYTTNLNTTRYGGTLDVVSGVLTVTDENIASYNGETLPSTWISDRDVYASGTTPTTGAQVVYKLATPTTVQLTAQEVELLVGLNNVWANSGDVTVEYGTNPNVVVNPTLFEARPMLEVEGYGTIGFNGYEIELADTTLGEIVLASAPAMPLRVLTFDKNKVANGDPIFFTSDPNFYATYMVKRESSVSSVSITTLSHTNVIVSQYDLTEKTKIISLTLDVSAGFVAGTPSSITGAWSGTLSYVVSGTTYTTTLSATLSIEFDGDHTIHFNISDLSGMPQTYFSGGTADNGRVEISAISSVGSLGHPTYIDCDLGEAYMIKDDVPISLDAYIDLGSDLPCLAVGANEFTYDNTITDLKVVPRWWKV